MFKAILLSAIAGLASAAFSTYVIPTTAVVTFNGNIYYSCSLKITADIGARTLYNP